MQRISDTKTQLWQRRLQDFSQSSQTVVQYCQSIGCTVQTFYQWRRKLQASTPRSQFLELHTQAPAGLELRLPGGAVLIVPLEAIDALPRILKAIS